MYPVRELFQLRAVSYPHKSDAISHGCYDLIIVPGLLPHQLKVQQIQHMFEEQKR